MTYNGDHLVSEPSGPVSVVSTNALCCSLFVRKSLSRYPNATNDNVSTNDSDSGSHDENSSVSSINPSITDISRNDQRGRQQNSFINNRSIISARRRGIPQMSTSLLISRSTLPFSRNTIMGSSLAAFENSMTEIIVSRFAE